MEPDPGHRKAHRPGEGAGPRIERRGRTVRVRSLEAARQVLRARQRTTQAGFTAESIPQGVLKHHPILMSDGPLHDQQSPAVQQGFDALPLSVAKLRVRLSQRRAQIV